MKIYFYRILVLITGMAIMVTASLTDYLSQKQLDELLEIICVLLKSIFHWGQ